METLEDLRASREAVRLRKRLAKLSGPQQTELFEDHEHQAELMWEAGYRPTLACDLEPGCFVAIAETLFGFSTGRMFDEVLVTSVAYDYDEAAIIVTSAHGKTEGDELVECWARKRR